MTIDHHRFQFLCFAAHCMLTESEPSSLLCGCRPLIFAQDSIQEHGHQRPLSQRVWLRHVGAQSSVLLAFRMSTGGSAGLPVF